MKPSTGDLESVTPSLLDRFARALAHIVHEERPEALSRSITVSELYQDIAPYRRMRELAGLELHADYEHALIRFLAGEGGYARLDPETAADELGIEAESSDPDLSLYRKFAACDVRLSLARPSGRLATDSPRPAPPAPPPISELAARAVEAARAAEIVEPEPAPPTAPPPPRAQSPAPSLAETMRALDPERNGAPVARRPAEAGTTVAARTAPRCAFCGQNLPGDRDVRFCPHCGVDQTARQCGSCGGDLQAGWRFCVACGAAAGT